MADNTFRRGSYAYLGQPNPGTQSNVEVRNASLGEGAFYLAKDPTLYEIQRANTFEFQVYGLNDNDMPMYDDGTNVIQDYANEHTEEVIRLSVSSAFAPSYEQNPVDVKRGNTTMHFAGTPTFQGGTIEFNDFIGAGTLEALMKWQNMSFNPYTEKVGLANDYKKICTLTEYTPTWQIVRQWKLYGCWLSSLKQGDFSYDGGDKQKVTANITYDYALLQATN